MESSTAEFVARQIACGRLPIITSLKAASRKARTWRDTHRLHLGLRRSAASHHFDSLTSRCCRSEQSTFSSVAAPCEPWTILAEGAIALSVTFSGGALIAS
jgi:hypothetical protein